MSSGTTPAVLHGGCLCGAVRFELTELPIEASYCHCTRCQRRTGTAAGASARIDGRALGFVAGIPKAARVPEPAARPRP